MFLTTMASTSDAILGTDTNHATRWSWHMQLLQANKVVIGDIGDLWESFSNLYQNKSSLMPQVISPSNVITDVDLSEETIGWHHGSLSALVRMRSNFQHKPFLKRCRVIMGLPMHDTGKYFIEMRDGYRTVVECDLLTGVCKFQRK